MLRISQLIRVPVYVPKGAGKGDPQELAPADLRLVGQVRRVVFNPAGDRVVGYLVRRPDVAGVVKREDAFVALDAVVANDEGLVVGRPDGMGDEARKRLQLDWDACILWCGMDARTSGGKELGWVDDVRFSAKTGRVDCFYVGDGSVARSLVGNVVIPASMLRGYADGCLIVDAQAARLELDGGLAAKAGEGYARAKLGGKQVASKVGKAAGSAAEKGAYGLGKTIGKAKKTVKSKGKKRLGSTKGMFGAFMEEYKKASK